MSFLSTILDEAEPKTTRRFKRLEQATGEQSIDVAYISHLKQVAIQTSKELGFDPLDTTAKELYQALRVRAADDEEILLARYKSNSHQLLKDIAGNFQKVVASEMAWSIKRSVLKKILTELTPLETMRQLRYRSAASLLKNEQIDVVLALAYKLEGDQWRMKLRQHYHHLQAGDFEARPMRVVFCTVELKRRFILPIVTVPEVGAIVVFSDESTPQPGYAFTLLSQVLGAYRHLKDASLLFKAHHVRQFPGWIVQEFLAPKHHQISIAGAHIDWSGISQSLRHNYSDEARHLFDVVLDHSDMDLQSPGQVLQALAPGLGFWAEKLGVGSVHGNEGVSLHIGDIGIDMLQKHDYATRSLVVLRAYVNREIMALYAARPILQRHIFKQLDKIELRPQTKAISIKRKTKIQSVARKKKA